MNVSTRKKIVAIQKYVVSNFSSEDWLNLGQLVGASELINGHGRLLRSLAFNDDDYEYNATEIINAICEKDEENVDLIVEFYDVDVWLEQKDPARYAKTFSGRSLGVTPNFWKKGYVKAFLSHLAANKVKAKGLKAQLESWGISSFVAHEDVEPTKEWMDEIEAALVSMDFLVALIEPEFVKSKWTDQEVGFALGRRVDVIALRIGADPYGFIGKYQAIQAKGKLPKVIAEEIVSVLLKKPRIKEKLFASFGVVLPSLDEDLKHTRLKDIDKLAAFSADQMKGLLEMANLSETGKALLKDLVKKYGAFAIKPKAIQVEDDLPF